MKLLVKWLDEGDGAGGLSASPAESQHPGEIAAAAALQEHQQKRAQKGKPREAPGAQRPASAQETVKAEPQVEAKPERDKAKEFEDLIKGDFKDEYSKRTSATIQERVKNIKASEETLSKRTPALEMLYQQKGIARGDVDALVKAITDDDSLYEE